MQVYYIANYTVHDPDKHADYLEHLLVAANEAGGNLVTASDQLTVIEGEPGSSLVIIGFRTIDEAQNFYASAAYQSLVGLWHDSSSGWAIVAQASATNT